MTDTFLGQYTFSTLTLKVRPKDPLGLFGKLKCEKHLKHRSVVECPYCHEPLWRFGGKSGAVRVIRVERQVTDNLWDVLYQWVPKTHQALKCQDCEQYFTVPSALPEDGR